MATRKRKRGPKHPGVTLVRPEKSRPQSGWRGRWVDVDTGKATTMSLSEYTTDEARQQWAVRKSAELARLRALRDPNAPRVGRVQLSDAIEDYYRDADNRLRPSTIELYKRATDSLLAWAKARNITASSDLKPAKLPTFRDWLLSQRRAAYVTGGRRGQRAAGEEKLSPLTINWQLRAAKTVLNHMRIRGLVPLTSDAIADALKPVPVPREAPEFLRPAECQALLEAALRHDAETMVSREDEAAIRAEAKRLGLSRAAYQAKFEPKGTTPRYPPIAPFVACVLLSGMRLSEALALRWAAVDLEALDADGRVVGEIRLKASETKTHHARTIGLDVSPTLRELLEAMHEHRGDAAYVFGGAKPMTKMAAEAARRRLVGTYGAPERFTWQLLRSTTATVQCNAPSLFGAAAAFVSAKRLGHSVQVSEKHYAGLFAVSREARTLEQAMGLVDLMARVMAAAKSRAENVSPTLTQTEAVC